MYRAISKLILTTTAVLLPFNGHCTREEEIFKSLWTFSSRLQGPLVPTDRNGLLEELEQFVKALPPLDQWTRGANGFEDLRKKNKTLEELAKHTEDALRMKNQIFLELSDGYLKLSTQKDKLQALLKSKEETLQASTVEQQELKQKITELQQSMESLKSRIKEQNAEQFNGENFDELDIPSFASVLVSPKKKIQSPLPSPARSGAARQLTFLPLEPVHALSKKISDMEVSLGADRDLNFDHQKNFMQDINRQITEISNAIDSFGQSIGFMLLAFNHHHQQIEDLHKNQQLLLSFMQTTNEQQANWVQLIETQNQQIGEFTQQIADLKSNQAIFLSFMQTTNEQQANWAQLIENQNQQIEGLKQRIEAQEQLPLEAAQKEEAFLQPEPTQTTWIQWGSAHRSKFLYGSAGLVGVYMAGKNLANLWGAFGQFKTEFSQYMLVITSKLAPPTTVMGEKF